jgi:hypothetical protein
MFSLDTFSMIFLMSVALVGVYILIKFMIKKEKLKLSSIITDKLTIKVTAEEFKNDITLKSYIKEELNKGNEIQLKVKGIPCKIIKNDQQIDIYKIH